MEILENKVLLAGVILFILAVILSNSNKCEPFLTGVPSYGTWDDYDNYAKLYGNTRDYWGSVAPGGGWTGHPLQPENNPGIAYMPTGPQGSGRGYNRPQREVNLVNANKQELQDMLNTQILATH